MRKLEEGQYDALVLALQFVLMARLNRHDDVPPLGWGAWWRAWWAEVLVAPRVFSWRQPFRWRELPDASVPPAPGRTAAVLVHGFVCNRGLWLPWMRAMRERYPDVRLHMVESLSGHLSNMLNARQLDLAVLFDTQPARRWSVLPLLDERLFLIRSAHGGASTLPAKLPKRLRLAQLQHEPLILPTGPHGLRSRIDAAFANLGFTDIHHQLAGAFPGT